MERLYIRFCQLKQNLSFVLFRESSLNGLIVKIIPSMLHIATVRLGCTLLVKSGIHIGRREVAHGNGHIRSF